MKKTLQFILLIAFLAISFTAKSQEKVLDLKDTYYNCGSRSFRVEFKILTNPEQFIPNFIIEPISAVEAFGFSMHSKNIYSIKLDEINSSCKVIYYENKRYDTLTGNETYDVIKSFDVIKLDTLPKPIITQIGNKLVSNIEGPHRWYLGNIFNTKFEDTPNNEYTPKMQGVYFVTLINPEYECVSAESKGFQYIINSVEEDIKYSNSQKYNITENTITFFDVGEIDINEMNSIEIYNVLGEKLELNLNNLNYTNNSISFQFDNNFNSLNSGMYLLVSKTNNKLRRFSFVK